MESKSIVIHKGGNEEKYKLYVEDYVLSYLKYETGTLEFSEIYLYGIRQNKGREYVIYGAGREKKIPVFDTYDLLEEIMCRLTQAGPVFMIREEEEVYQIKGFDVFYQDNEAMQSYMVERKKNFSRSQKVKQADKHVAPSLSAGKTEQTEMKPGRAHGVMSAQLGVILIILVAIVINSANSYDKMEQLNRSAEEVFFAIENQEAEELAADSYEPAKEIVVKRNEDQTDGLEEGVTDGDEIQHEQTDNSEMEDIEKVSVEDSGDVEESAQEENIGSAIEEGSAENKQEESKKDAAGEEGNLKEVSDIGEEQEDEDVQTEALSRNVTRYYKVEKGDTLYTICEKIYGDTSQVGKICELNDISDPDRIRSGQKIILP